ncbi:hypothetical protein Q669_06885 [Labrenzia sp. C1B10]|nr:hypothetical protein Q669_06885 [Labrenzia sp. C1B10]ERS08705.1 hypothetical protein Q675_19010 [Labrenzia sp. C1B70]
MAPPQGSGLAGISVALFAPRIEPLSKIPL